MPAASKRSRGGVDRGVRFCDTAAARSRNSLYHLVITCNFESVTFCLVVTYHESAALLGIGDKLPNLHELPLNWGHGMRDGFVDRNFSLLALV